MNVNKNIISFLRGYSSDIQSINRLIVSLFCRVNNVKVKENKLILNLLIKEDGNELNALEKFIAIYTETEADFNFEKLIEIFEFVISPLDKLINGAVYTPKLIREYIIQSSIEDMLDLDSTACDVACGCGGFLYNFALLLNKKGKAFKDIFSQNLYGLDITDYSIERTKILLSLLAIYELEDAEDFEFNFFVGNSLEFDWFENSSFITNNGGFDYVFSNPPYVGSSNMDEDNRKLLKRWQVARTGKADLYIPFFEIGLKWLKNSGTLGYITVNSFYKSLNGRALRDYFSINKYEFRLIDFGSEQLFKNRITYTCICIIRKKAGQIKYTKGYIEKLLSLKEDDFVDIMYDSLNNKEGWLLDNFEIQSNIRKIENAGKKLGEIFNIKNGFATLRNKIYLFTPFKEDEHYYFLKTENKIYMIEKNICRDAIKPNILKSESEIPVIVEKLIFPYEIKKDNLLFDNNNSFVSPINEENMIGKFPNTYQYLVDNKNELSKRDKGTREYSLWYVYGRSQALNIKGKKLLFPYMSDNPYFVYTDDENLLFYNGYAIVSDSEQDLKFIQKIVTSSIFWYYIQYTSKPYSGNYFALAKNYIKNFGVPAFSTKEKATIMKLKSKKKIDLFLSEMYNIKLPSDV